MDKEKILSRVRDIELKIEAVKNDYGVPGPRRDELEDCLYYLGDIRNEVNYGMEFEITELHEKRSQNLEKHYELLGSGTSVSCFCPSALCIKEKVRPDCFVRVGGYTIELGAVNELKLPNRIKTPPKLLTYIRWWDGTDPDLFGEIKRDPIFRPESKFILRLPEKCLPENWS